MIYYLKGKVIIKKEKFIVLDVSGVGYKIFVSEKTLSNIDEENLEIFCFLSVKENSMELYGFLRERELQFFEILESISGVGPKAALEIASLGPLEKFKEEIERGNTEIFESISGIGKKKAQKIILELSGKIKEISKKKKVSSEEQQALTNLGFTNKEAEEALSQVSLRFSKEERIQKALEILGK